MLSQVLISGVHLFAPRPAPRSIISCCIMIMIMIIIIIRSSSSSSSSITTSITSVTSMCIGLT